MAEPYLTQAKRPRPATCHPFAFIMCFSRILIRAGRGGGRTISTPRLGRIHKFHKNGSVFPLINRDNRPPEGDVVRADYEYGSEGASGEEEVHEDRSCVELELEVPPRVSEGINRAPSLCFPQSFSCSMENFPACRPITELHLGHVKV